jgi:hypothetical protein
MEQIVPVGIFSNQRHELGRQWKFYGRTNKELNPAWRRYLKGMALNLGYEIDPQPNSSSLTYYTIGDNVPVPFPGRSRRIYMESQFQVLVLSFKAPFLIRARRIMLLMSITF